MGVGVGVAVGDGDGVAVGLGVSVCVGATYGVAVGNSSAATTEGLTVLGVGAAVPVQAITAAAAAKRATNAPATATVIGFLLAAILGCHFHKFIADLSHHKIER